MEVISKPSGNQAINLYLLLDRDKKRGGLWSSYLFMYVVVVLHFDTTHCYNKLLDVLKVLIIEMVGYLASYLGLRFTGSRLVQTFSMLKNSYCTARQWRAIVQFR